MRMCRGEGAQSAPAEAVAQRYEQINAFEKHLVENGTIVLKFMLHISKEEQRERLQERLMIGQALEIQSRRS